MQNYGYNEFCAWQTNISQAQGSDSATASVAIGGSNAMGSWTDLLGTTLAEDCYGIQLKMNNGHTSGTSRPILMDIGYDPAGGSSYSVLIPYVGVCGPLDKGGTQWRGGGPYFFPVFIPKGSRIAARAQSSLATPGSTNVYVRIAQKPTRPDLLRVGTFVDAIGIDATHSRGTAYTPGVNADGAWTLLGTLPRDAWMLVPGVINDSTSQTNDWFQIDVAVGDTTSKLLMVQKLMCGHSSSDSAVFSQYPEEGMRYALPAGSSVYVRGDQHSSLDPNYTAFAYAVGGH